MPEPSLEERLALALADRYAIEGEIGAGGMATVYVAEDLKHDRKVALKVLSPDQTRDLGAERFLREIKTAATLTHPHILPLFDSGEADGFLYYVMPFVEGGSLRSRLTKERQLPVEDAIQITREIADALAYAHKEGVIHRDVKPANIMLEEGHAVLADFGVAHAVAAARDERITQTGISLGTPTYMSPEQATGGEHLDGRTDQYALGCVLFEMLTGYPPFTGAEVEAVVRQHLTLEPPSVTEARPTVTAEVEKVIYRALAKRPADRFKTTGEMAAALGGSATPVRAGGRWGRTKTKVFAGVAVLGLATVAVVASTWVSRGPEFLDDVVIVLPFSNETGGAENEGVGKALAWAIGDRLDRTGIVRVVRHGQATLSWEAALERRAGEPVFDPVAAVAFESRAGIVVWGSVFPQGDSLHLLAEVSSSGGDERIASIGPVVVASERIAEGIDTVSERVAGAIALHLDPNWGGFVSVMAPVPSLAVVEAYARATEMFLRDTAESRREAERALQLNPTYFPAKTMLAVYHYNRGNYAAADSLLDETEEFRDRMARERIQWDWARAALDGDRRAAYRSQVEAMRRTPHPYNEWSLGFEAIGMNYPQEAFEVLSAMDPDSPAMRSIPKYWSDLGEALHMLGDHKQELKEVRQGRALHPDRSRVLQAEIRARAALGHIEEVRELIEEAIRKEAGPARAAMTAMQELRAHGHLEASRAMGELGLANLRERSAEVAETASHRIALVETLYCLERWDEAHVIAEGLVQEDPSKAWYLGYLGLLTAHRGYREEAAQISDRLASMEIPYDRGFSTAYRALIAAALGEKEVAVALLRQAHEEGHSFSVGIHTYLDLEPLRGYPAFEEFMRPKG